MPPLGIVNDICLFCRIGQSIGQLLPLPVATSFPLSLTAWDLPATHDSVFGEHPGHQVVSVKTTARLDGR